MSSFQGPSTNSVGPSRKRSSVSGVNKSGNSTKRRKASAGPSQLWQTSFPTDATNNCSSQVNLIENFGSAQSPGTSDGVYSPGGGSRAFSTISGGSGSPSLAGASFGGNTSALAIATATTSSRRGKKKMSSTLGSIDGTRDQSNVMSGRAKHLNVGGQKSSGVTNFRGDSTALANSQAGGGADDDEDDDIDDAHDMSAEGGKMDEAAQKQEREHLSMLLEAFNLDQSERYDIWRRVRLKKEVVRKITNQTLSQSVPQSVITTINGYTKIFIGELIERARQVQLEWLSVASTFPNGDPISPDTPLSQRTLERDRGPLLPDHLREAFRRYKRGITAANTGFVGLSLGGKENAVARFGGRRMLR